MVGLGLERGEVARAPVVLLERVLLLEQGVVVAGLPVGKLAEELGDFGVGGGVGMGSGPTRDYTAIIEFREGKVTYSRYFDN